MLLDLEKLSVWFSLRRRDDACSSSDSDPVGIRPCSRQAQGSSIWERGGARGRQVPQLLPRAAEQPGAALWMSPGLLGRLGSWEALDAGLV